MSSSTEESSVLTTLLLNVGLVSVGLIFFEVVRVRFVDVFSPKWRRGEAAILTAPTEAAKTTARIICPPDPGKSWFSWIRVLLTLDDDELMRTNGMDAYVYLSTIRFALRIACTFLIALVILAPLYQTAGRSDGHVVEGLDKVTVTNLPDGDSRFWATIIVAYVLFLRFLVIIHRQYEQFFKMRTRFLSGYDRLLPPQLLYSVIVENIPVELRSSSALASLFEEVFPGKVACAEVFLEATPLEAAVKKRDQVLASLELAVAEYEASDRLKRPIIRFLGGASGIEVLVGGDFIVDAIDFYEDKLAVLNKHVELLRMQTLLAAGSQLSPTIDNNFPSDGSISITDPASLASSIPSALRQTKSSLSKEEEEEDDVDADEDVDDEGSISHTEERLDSEDQSLPSSRSSRISFCGTPDAQIKRKKDSRRHKKLLERSIRSLVDDIKVFSKDKIGGVLVSEVKNLVEEYKSTLADQLVTGTGFVTFRTRTAQSIATNFATIFQDYPQMRISAMPHPKDIIWSNLKIPPATIEFTSQLTKGMYYSGIFGWSVVVAFITAISRLSYLDNYLPFIKRLPEEWYTILGGILPAVMMLIVLALLPVLMRVIAYKIERRKTLSDVERQVFGWYFLYQMANVYITLTATTAWQSLSNENDDQDDNLLTRISASLPAGSTFFMNLVLMQCFSAIILPMIRLAVFSQWIWIRWFGAIWYNGFCYKKDTDNEPEPEVQWSRKTIGRRSFADLSTLSNNVDEEMPPEYNINACLTSSPLNFSEPPADRRLTRRKLLEGPLSSESIAYGTIVPDVLFQLAILMLYAVLSPLIIPCVVCLLSGMYFVMKYQIVYVMERNHEGGGTIWYEIHFYVMIIALLATVVMSLYLLIRGEYAQFIASIPLPLIMLWAWRRTTATFELRSKTNPYDTAVHADRGMRGSVQYSSNEMNFMVNGFSRDFLLQPSMQAKTDPSPYPYRVHDNTLFDEHGSVNLVYFADDPNDLFYSSDCSGIRDEQYSPNAFSPMQIQHPDV